MPISFSRAFTAFAVIFCLSPSPSTTSARSPLLSLLLLALLIKLLVECGKFGFEAGNRVALGGEVTGDKNLCRNKVRLEAALAALEVMLLRPDYRRVQLFEFIMAERIIAQSRPMVARSLVLIARSKWSTRV